MSISWHKKCFEILLLFPDALYLNIKRVKDGILVVDLPAKKKRT